MEKFRNIVFGSEKYFKEIVLRDKYLRKPLGLSFSDEYLNKEKDDLHFGLFDEQDKIIACLVITKLSSMAVHLRQMVVENSYRKMGKGKELLNAAEEYLKKEGIMQIEIHSRKYAVEFYQKSGYEVKGDEFIEVGIPHLKLVKAI
jgi:predicted GNAT family N-acyltransferase